MQKKSVFYFLFLGLITLPYASDAGIRVGNSSRSNAQGYQQVNTSRAQNSAQSTSAAIAVSPTAYGPANMYSQNTNTGTVQTLPTGTAAETGAITQNSQDRQAYCQSLYPYGEFTWGRPNIGSRAGGEETCVAVIEMRAANAAPDNSDLTFVRAYLAAGDRVRCNISDFPDTSYLPVPDDFFVPADKEPTIDDVKAQMNKEQKQNAGLKIATTALITGLAGNFMAESEPGSDSMLGFGKKKMIATAEALAGGAALGAASAYSGKVGGDMIMSAGMNMMAGAIVGNMGATGGEDLLIQECKKSGEQKNSGWCLVGYIEQQEELSNGNSYVNITDYTDTYYCSTDNDNSTTTKKAKCKYVRLSESTIKLDNYNNDTATKSVKDSANAMGVLRYAEQDKYSLVEDKNKNFCISKDETMKSASDTNSECKDDRRFVKLNDGKKVSQTIPAAVYLEEKPRGNDIKNYAAFKEKFGKTEAEVYGRAAGGDLISLTISEMGGKDRNKDGSFYFKDVQNNFTASSVGADEGDLIDINSRARAKATGIGAGMGGAMGAFTAYQGATSEIEERWLSEVRAYKDSLSKFYCMTGGKFLSRYNDYVVITAAEEGNQ